MTTSSPQPSTKTVLITGASGGIGEATARHLAALRHQVVLGARRADRIAAIAAEIDRGGGAAFGQELDVTSLESMRSFVDGAQRRFGRIDALVNNAGVMPLSPLSDLRIDEWNAMIDVNLRGVLHGIAAVLPIMRDQGSGHIVNIASVSGYRVDPTAAVYSATKFAVRALSEGLRQESSDLRVTVVSPGFTRTDLFDSIAAPEVRDAVRGMLKGTSIAPGTVAEAIGFALEQPDDVDVNEIVVRPTAQL